MAPWHDCWSSGLGGPGPNGGIPNPSDRFNFCSTRFGGAMNQSLNRDFPILQAFDDHLVVGYFTQSRDIGPAPRTDLMKALACCFHHQANFHVRTGGEWVAFGSETGILHHVTSDPASGRCVLSCDADRALFNARVLGIVADVRAAEDADSFHRPAALVTFVSSACS